jgi:hypothetical protein
MDLDSCKGGFCAISKAFFAFRWVDLCRNPEAEESSEEQFWLIAN